MLICYKFNLRRKPSSSSNLSVAVESNELTSAMARSIPFYRQENNEDIGGKIS